MLRGPLWILRGLVWMLRAMLLMLRATPNFDTRLADSLGREKMLQKIR